MNWKQRQRIKRIVIIGRLLMLAVAVIFLFSGCAGRKYIHETYHSNGKLASREVVIDRFDKNNPERAIADVPVPPPPSIPDGAVLPGVAPQALVAGAGFASSPATEQDPSVIMAQNGGHYFETASGAKWGTQIEDASTYMAVLGSTINTSASTAGTTALGLYGLNVSRSVLNTRQTTEQIGTKTAARSKDFAERETTRRAAIEAKKDIRIKEIVE